MASSAREWRRAREIGIEIHFLTADLTAFIRPIEVDFFARVGRVPDSLAPVVSKLINGESVVFDVPPSEQVKQSEDWRNFLNDLACFAFVSPVVRGAGEPLADDEISVDDIPYNDKVHLYHLFCRPAKVLERFRDLKKSALADVELAANNRPATLENSAD